MPTVERYRLAPRYTISRVIKGGWQLAGGHGPIDREQALHDMLLYVEKGTTTFDCADIYTGVEELIGRFLVRFGERFKSGELPPVQIHTKYVPDLGSLASLEGKDVERVIDRSLRRLNLERLDLVQFHWWDLSLPGYVEAALHLDRLRRAGKIRHIGLTNFDAPHVREILEAGVPVVSNQVQYSLLDRRPEKEMIALAEEWGFFLLCYGALAGGFLSDRYIGTPDPGEPLENRSLVKYRLIIDEFGGYERFQDLLGILSQIAFRHGVGAAEVAVRFILDKPRVAGVIIGARNREHLERLTGIEGLVLDREDIESIESFLDCSSGPAGPVYGLERDRSGKHSRIMKYNLSRNVAE